MDNTCPSCNAPINWMQGSNGKSKPVNLDGTDHQCQNAPKVAAQKEAILEPVNQTVAPVGSSARVVHPSVSASDAVIRNIAEHPDSLEIGTPGTGGALKIYFDSSDSVDAELRIRNALALRDLANGIISGKPATLAERMSA